MRDKNIDNFKFEKVQTYRETQQTPNCNRHKKIFNTAEIIPQHCFGCYKVQNSGILGQGPNEGCRDQSEICFHTSFQQKRLTCQDDHHDAMHYKPSTYVQ